MTENSGDENIDAVDLKRQAQAKIRKMMEGLTPEERRDLYGRLAEEGPLGERWRQIRARFERASA